MCLKPIKLRNPTERIAKCGGQPLMLEVPCGHCAECKKNKRLEWHFRAYHECNDTIKKGGFVYFDTLTYRDEDVPHLSDYYDISDKKEIADFMCFNNAHWRNFLKVLRSRLAYTYKGVSFKYFLTSEYGTDERYTHRPHYHILFFVYGPIHPFVFSNLVSECWLYGFTDGLPRQTTAYVMEHVFGYDFERDEPSRHIDFASTSKVCNYVSKYVTKDSTFQKVIDGRIELLSKYIKDEEELKQLKRSIDMFHRNSQGFGIGYLNRLSRDEYLDIMHKGICSRSDSQKVVCVIKLPLYYKRKLFYKVIKDADNKIKWQLNELGIEYQDNMFFNSINNVVTAYSNQLLNLKNDDYNIVVKLLNNRTIEDFVIYKLFYKGRCRALEQTFDPHSCMCGPMCDDEHNLYDWLHRIISSNYVYTKPDSDIYVRNREDNFISVTLSYGDLFSGAFDTKQLTYTHSLIKNLTFYENSCTAFHNFDKLDLFLSYLKIPENTIKQETFEFLEDLTIKFKLLELL